MRKKAMLALVCLTFILYLPGAVEIKDVRLDRDSYHIFDEATITWRSVNLPPNSLFNIELLDSNRNYFCTIKENLPFNASGSLYKWKIEDTCLQYNGTRKEIVEGTYYVKVKLATVGETSIYGISNPFQIRKQQGYPDAEGWETFYPFTIQPIVRATGFEITEGEKGEDSSIIKATYYLKLIPVRSSYDNRIIFLKIQVKKEVKEPRSFFICVRPERGGMQLPSGTRFSPVPPNIYTMHAEGEVKEFRIGSFYLPLQERIYNQEYRISLIIVIRDSRTPCRASGVIGNMSKRLNLVLRIKPAN